MKIFLTSVLVVFSATASAVSITTPKPNAVITAATQKAIAVFGACEVGIKVKLYLIDSASKSTTVVSVDCKESKYSGSLDASALAEGNMRVKASQVVGDTSQIAYQSIVKQLTVVVPSPTPSPSPTVSPPSGKVSAAPSRFAKLAAGTVSIKASTFAAAVTAAASAKGNTIINLPAGTFTDVMITLVGNGISASQPIIVQGAANGKTILAGKTYIKISGKYLALRNLNFQKVTAKEYSGSGTIIQVSSCMYCGLDHIRMDGGPSAVMVGADDSFRHKWVRIEQNSKGLEVGNSSFINKWSGGSVLLVERSAVWGGQADAHRFFNNVFSGRRLQVGANDFDTIRLGASTGAHSPDFAEAAALLEKGKGIAGTIVEFNVFENTDLAPDLLKICIANNYKRTYCTAEPEIISVKSPQNVIRFNTFRNNYGGLTLRHGFQNIAEGNFFSGKNTPAGINSINQNSYGIRIIGSDNVVVNNHMEDLYLNHEMFGGISMMAGQVAADDSGYWQVLHAVVAFNYISNAGPDSLALAAGYGNTKDAKYRVLAPEDVVFSNNAMFTAGTMVDSQFPTEDYLKRFVVKNLYYSAAAFGVAGMKGTKLVATTKAISGRGFSAPSNSQLIGSSGILRTSTSAKALLVKDLATLAGGSPAKVVEDLMANLTLGSGTVYESYSPLLPSEVGAGF
jgi:hypothetical protein